MSYCDIELDEFNKPYHDNEWGIPIHNDRKQFEYLMLEVMQCGLSWTPMLKKREIFRSCFHNFDYDIIAKYGEEDIERILKTDGMIRSRRKIEAVIHSFQNIRKEFGSFDDYLWAYSDNKTILYNKHEDGLLPVSIMSLSSGCLYSLFSFSHVV